MSWVRDACWMLAVHSAESPRWRHEYERPFMRIERGARSWTMLCKQLRFDIDCYTRGELISYEDKNQNMCHYALGSQALLSCLGCEQPHKVFQDCCWISCRQNMLMTMTENPTLTYCSTWGLQAQNSSDKTLLRVSQHSLICLHSNLEILIYLAIH